MADDGTVFDVMVVYTPAARVSAGGTNAIETRIQLGITETNQAYANSNIIPRLRLVHTEEVSYTESPRSMSDDLNRLTSTSDGYMDSVHALRNAYGADLVSLIVQRYDYCGIAWLMSGNSPAFESAAFSVVDEFCISPNYSFGHELGHNMGCNHAPDDPVGTGAFNYSFGYKDPSEWFRTIMAYNCPGGCPRIPYFSNPTVDFGGRTTGAALQDNARSINNVRMTVANWRTNVVPDATLSLDKSSLVFNVTTNRSNLTSPQTVLVNVAGTGTVNWSVSSDQSWVQVSPSNGTGRGSFKVSMNASTVPLTSWNATITVTSPDVSNSPQTVSVSGSAYSAGSTSAPFGVFDTPLDGTTGITGAISVSGWALDDIEVTGVQIWRDPVSGEGSTILFVGDAVFVEGARPDIETAYPGFPFSYRGGWGYVMLTHGLPNQGNGTYRIHAYATDQEGHQVLLGSKTISVANASAARPFGTIDTPPQGGTVSGIYPNWGWVLTPQPYSMPPDGSTIQVYVDGVLLGTLDYGYYRADIATAFPGYQNSLDGVGVYDLDTTAYDNGVHTIGWYAVDDGSRADGIGSRFFVIDNTGSMDQDVRTKRR
jgi:hypothetical protein